MAYYSLVASLPHLKIGDEPPFSTEEFVEDCARRIADRETQILRKTLLSAPDVAPCPLCRKLNDLETQIRNASARFRGQKAGTDASGFLRPHEGFVGEIERAVEEAFSREDPVELEEGLDRLRWRLADEIVPLDDPFGFEKVLAYGIQLKIVERWHRMSESEGKRRLEAIIDANAEERTQPDPAAAPANE